MSRISFYLVVFKYFFPQGDFDSFAVHYRDAKGGVVTNSTNTNSIRISNLRPFRNYTFTIITRAGIANQQTTVPR